MNIDFSKYIKEETFKNFINSKEVSSKELTDEILTGLKTLVINGMLQEVEFSDIHKTNFSYSWNMFVNDDFGDDGYLIRDIEYLVEKIYYFGIRKDNSYEDFISFLNKGDFDTYCTPESYCFNCGITTNVIFKNWKPTFYEFKEIADPTQYRKVIREDSPLSYLNKMDHIKADTCFNEFLKVKDFEVKSNEIFVFDWIRLDEFTENIEKNKNIHHFDINCIKGRSDAFEHYFNQGVISISLGRSSLEIYKHKDKELKNCLIFGKENYSYDEEEENTTKSDVLHKGMINGDLRAITIAEKETLITIINKTVNDKEKANDLLDKYISKNKDSVKRIKVSPGVYNVVFDLGDNDLTDLYFPKSHTKEIEPMVYFYPKELYPSNKNKIKP